MYSQVPSTASSAGTLRQSATSQQKLQRLGPKSFSECVDLDSVLFLDPAMGPAHSLLAMTTA